MKVEGKDAKIKVSGRNIMAFFYLQAFTEEIRALTKLSQPVPESQRPVKHHKNGINKNSPLIPLNPNLSKAYWELAVVYRMQIYKR